MLRVAAGRRAYAPKRPHAGLLLELLDGHAHDATAEVSAARTTVDPLRPDDLRSQTQQLTRLCACAWA
jgi:hypothetical protein